MVIPSINLIHSSYPGQTSDTATGFHNIKELISCYEPEAYMIDLNSLIVYGISGIRSSFTEL